MIIIIANTNEFGQCARHSLKHFNSVKDSVILKMHNQNRDFHYPILQMWKLKGSG